MAGAEGGSVPNGVGVWWGVSSLQPIRGSGGASWAPPAGFGAELRSKTDFGVFWRPQNAPFCIYMTKIGGGQFALAFPYSKFWEDLSPASPRDLRPCVDADAVLPLLKQMFTHGDEPALSLCLCLVMDLCGGISTEVHGLVQWLVCLVWLVRHRLEFPAANCRQCCRCRDTHDYTDKWPYTHAVSWRPCWFSRANWRYDRCM